MAELTGPGYRAVNEKNARAITDDIGTHAVTHDGWEFHVT